MSTLTFTPLADIVKVCLETRCREGSTIEYKSSLDIKNDGEKKEFLADVSAFANGQGGDILFGVEEERDPAGKTTGVPKCAPGLPGTCEQEMQRVEQLLLSSIAPRFQYEMRAIPADPNKHVLALRVRRSWRGPHMVTYGGSSRFYVRTSTGKIQMEIDQIRAAFLRSDDAGNRIRNLRLDRIARIVAGDAPGDIKGAPALVGHLVPLGALANEINVDLQSLRSSSIPPPVHGRRLGLSIHD